MRVADTFEVTQGRAGCLAVPGRTSAGQHRVDRGCHQLDVTELLGRDVRNQVVERPRTLAAAEVERLEAVIQERRHLPEPTAEQLLHGSRAGWIGIGRGR